MALYKGEVVILFLVTSAVNSCPQRLAETRETIESIHRACPIATIWVLESSFEHQGVSFPRATIKVYSDEFIRNIDRTKDIGYIKSAIELHTTIDILDRIPNRFSHIFKISGRYTLTEHFNLGNHPANKATFALARATGFPLDYVGTDGMLMTRLYSMGYTVIPQVKAALEKTRDFFHKQWDSGKVFDIEHGLYKFLPIDIRHEVDKIGVRGRIGHLTHIVED
jgi:hypothetical protein